MSSFDKTMRFDFQEDPMEHDVKEVLLLYMGFRKKDIIRSIKSSVICYQEIRPIFQGTRMHVVSSESWNVTRSLKNWSNRI